MEIVAAGRKIPVLGMRTREAAGGRQAVLHLAGPLPAEDMAALSAGEWTLLDDRGTAIGTYSLYTELVEHVVVFHRAGDLDTEVRVLTNELKAAREEISSLRAEAGIRKQ